jgi:hypothetical protein
MVRTSEVGLLNTQVGLKKQDKLTKFVAIIALNLLPPKAGAKHGLVVNKPASIFSGTGTDNFNYQ